MPGLQRFYVKPGNPELCGPSKGLPLWDRDAQAPLSGLPSCSSLGPQGQGAADTLSSGAIAGESCWCPEGLPCCADAHVV